MSLDADAIVDRRRLRRKLTFWRVLAALVVLLAAGGFVFASGARRRPRRRRRLCRPRQGGRASSATTAAGSKPIERLARSHAKAVIVHIDSPGGTTAGSQQLYDALRALQVKKPMVVVVDGLAASGAYIAALACDHIIAHDTSIVGSIGVLFQYPNFAEALKTLGIKVEIDQIEPAQSLAQRFRADQPGGARRRRGGRARLLCLVQEPGADPPQDGRRPAGRGRRRPRLHRPPGLGLKLVDAVGNEQTALAWLAREKHVPANTPVRDYPLEPRFSELSFLHAAAWTFQAIGLSAVAQRIEEWGAVRAVERLNLDGLLALWHPA